MPCHHPLAAWKVGDQVVFWAKEGGVRMNLPCGQCRGCRLRRAQFWATRCLHESQMHAVNCFVTLTYRDPCPVSLDYSHFQKFIRSLRKRVKVPVRFFACGEYGEQTLRPHFHACLFGVDFLDKKFHKTSPSGGRLYVSKFLEEVWPHGQCWIGAVTFQSASYVARYVMKKVTGCKFREFVHYNMLDVDTGEYVSRLPEMVHMSLKPGIGAGWLQKFGSDVYPSGDVVVNGKKARAPRFYDSKLSDEDRKAVSDRRYWRMLERKERLFDPLFDAERLKDDELILERKTNLFKREI